MAINSKQKGKRGENQLVHALNDLGYPNVHRSVQYNGRHEEGQPDLTGLSGIHVECKFVERLNIQDAMDQAKRDHDSSTLPAVFHKRSCCEWLVTMTLEDWVKLYAEYVNKE